MCGIESLPFKAERPSAVARSPMQVDEFGLKATKCCDAMSDVVNAQFADA
jgi:hypothetical protein